MPKIMVKHGQSLLDIAVKYYGTAEGAFDIVKRNSLNGITDFVYPGEEIEVADNPLNRPMTQFLSPHTPATLTPDIQPQGIGYWQIAKNFIVSTS